MADARYYQFFNEGAPDGRFTLSKVRPGKYRLVAYADRSDVLVLGLPRGGVPVAYEVARQLHVALDVLIVGAAQPGWLSPCSCSRCDAVPWYRARGSDAR